MKQKTLLLLLAPFVIAFLSSCSTGGAFIAHNVTNVELSEPNFNYIARNVEGSSSADYLIGVSYSTGFMANSMSLIRIGGTAKLYDSAIQNLWNNFEEKFGPTNGKKLALVNVRYDTDILNLLVYTQTKLFISADVIEFQQ